jgi:predicted alpha/beta-hydrolase family hydrolase
MTIPLSITLPDGRTVTALRDDPAGESDWTFAYAPGAGANIHDPFGAYLAREFPARGIALVRFQFPYQEAGKRSPDRPDVLEATWRAMIETLRPGATRLAVGGRSMGGRIASQVLSSSVASGPNPMADALVLFAYPLHPPGRPDQLRDAHLHAITVPTLFCSGANDAFASPEELRAAAAKVPNASVHLMDAADHGFNTPKASGRTRGDIWGEAANTAADWLAALTA